MRERRDNRGSGTHGHGGRESVCDGTFGSRASWRGVAQPLPNLAIGLHHVVHGAEVPLVILGGHFCTGRAGTLLSTRFHTRACMARRAVRLRHKGPRCGRRGHALASRAAAGTALRRLKGSGTGGGVPPWPHGNHQSGYPPRRPGSILASGWVISRGGTRAPSSLDRYLNTTPLSLHEYGFKHEMDMGGGKGAMRALILA